MPENKDLVLLYKIQAELFYTPTIKLLLAISILTSSKVQIVKFTIQHFL